MPPHLPGMPRPKRGLSRLVQGEIGSCTANAAAGLLEYHRKRAYDKEGTVSRMFIYKATRDLMQSDGDSGAYIRTTMGALALIGAPPEKYWGYGAERLDRAPPAFCYSYAQNYQALAYYRLDEKPSAGDKGKTLSAIRETLASGLPPMFGFHVFESIRGAQGGRIPFPGKGEKEIGGHAVLAVGYDNGMEIGESKGAFLIRNSWGEGWGEKGYGWLPYDYLLKGLAEDWWVLVKAEWVDEGQFGV